MRRPMVLLPILPRGPGRKRPHGALLGGEVGLGVLADGVVDGACEGWEGEGEVSGDADVGYDGFFEEGVWGELEAAEEERCCGILRMGRAVLGEVM